MLPAGKTLSRRVLCLIISLALLELSQSTYSSCLSEVRVRPWARIIEGMSDKTRLKQGKNVMNTALKFKKNGDLSPKRTYIQDFDSRGVGL